MGVSHKWEGACTFCYMRVRMPELLTERGWSAYRVAEAVKALGGSEQAVYRLAAANGRVRYFDGRLMVMLCDVFGIGFDELLIQAKDDTDPPPVVKKPAPKRKPKPR